MLVVGNNNAGITIHLRLEMLVFVVIAGLLH
jgi:hypothetical protein